MQAPAAAAASIEAQALALQATVLAHRRLREAATAFATELATARHCTRVGVGMARRHQAELVALSHGSNENLHRQAFHGLTAAMDEAMQQGRSVHWPADGPPAIRQAHMALLADRGGAVATLPIVYLGRTVGAITCQWSSPPADLPALVAELEHSVSLAGPVLYLMHLRELPLHRRWATAWRDGLEGEQAARRRRLLGAATAAVLAAALLLALPVEHQVGGQARIEGQQTRALVAPADGFLQAVHVRPGDRVAAQQLLLEMSDQDLLLQQRRWSSELAQHENAYAAALTRADRAAMVIALARVEEARAHLGLVEAELERSRITAPFDGIVVEGDLSQQLGAPVERGKALLQLAPLDRYRVMLQIDERDIHAVRLGQQGALALSALPWDSLPIEVVRITPVARAVEGRNVFEV